MEIDSDDVQILYFALIYYSDLIRSEIDGLSVKIENLMDSEKDIDRHKLQYYTEQFEVKKSLHSDIEKAFVKISEIYDGENSEVGDMIGGE